jgi:hypothetical protein
MVVVSDHNGLVRPAALRGLRILRCRIRLRPRTPIALPLFGRGAILRGAFGLVYRRLVCHDMALDCRVCPLLAGCPYPEVFEPRPPAGSTRLRTFSDIPRPFVVAAPTSPQTVFGANDQVEFGLSIVGSAARHLPYFVTTFRALGEAGLGPRRGRFDLEEVAAVGPAGGTETVYRRGCPEVAVNAVMLSAEDLVAAGDLDRDTLRLWFATPTDIRDNGRTVDRPQFRALVRRLRDRVSALAAFFGERPLEIDFKAVGDVAESVKLVEDRTRRLEVRRTSGRTGQEHDIGGFVGQARYEGAAIGPLMPLVRLGELLHVGKHAAFGNGRIEVVE